MSGLTENGLKIQIKHLEEIIELRKGKDCSFEKSLLKEWRKDLSNGRRRRKLSPDATKSKSEGL